jgi:PIN domain nuclease of toxin-antitoxin system
MRLLLDTHIALWVITDDPRLPAAARALVADQTNSVHVSAVTIWEIAIKHALNRSGPNAMPLSAAEALEYFRGSGYALLPITPEHARAVEDLPALHGDPFDRMLVAQAIVEPLRLVTQDPVVARYGETVVRV